MAPINETASPIGIANVSFGLDDATYLNNANYKLLLNSSQTSGMYYASIWIH
jgi:hypothetical protein